MDGARGPEEGEPRIVSAGQGAVSDCQPYNLLGRATYPGEYDPHDLVCSPGG
jgi:hypothetical protein